MRWRVSGVSTSKTPRVDSRVNAHLARAVDGHLQVRAAVQHGSGEHAHGDGLAKPSGRRDQDLLREMVPSVDLQDPLMVLRKRAVGLALPEDPCACSNKVVVEHPLVERALPPPPVDRLQPLSAPLHAVEAGVCSFRCHAQVVLQRGPAHPPFPLLLHLHPGDAIIVFKVIGEEHCGFSQRR